MILYLSFRFNLLLFDYFFILYLLRLVCCIKFRIQEFIVTLYLSFRFNSLLIECFYILYLLRLICCIKFRMQEFIVNLYLSFRFNSLLIECFFILYLLRLMCYIRFCIFKHWWFEDKFLWWATYIRFYVLSRLLCWMRAF